MSEIKLKVAEAIQDDVNKGITRVDSSLMRQIDAKPGDVIEIKGGRSTVAIVDRAYPGDIGLNIIRMDGIIRRNAKTSISEMVSIVKADVKEAKKVTLAPAHKGIVVKASPNAFKAGLLGRALVKGDIVSLGGARRRRTTMTGSPFFEDIFRMLEEEASMPGFGFHDLKFIAVDVSPKGPAFISDSTEVVLNPEAVEVREEVVLDVTYEDIGGLHDEIKKIREMVELPLKHPEIFERLGIEAPKGVLLHGPPGTGKTLLAKAVANESNSHFILINGPEIMSKFYGQSEENLRKKFEEAEKNAPAIIFIDEVDSLAPKREEVKGEVERRVVAQLLTMMDGLKSRGKVVVIAATNVPNILDPALRRPGRFDREIDIGVPDKKGRLKILKIHTRNMPISPKSDLRKAKVLVNEALKSLTSEGALLSKDGSANAKALQRENDEEVKVLSECQKFLAGLSSKEFNSFVKESSGSEAPDKVKSKVYDLLKEDMLKEIAEKTYGFVGADLAALSKEAAMMVLRRILPDLNLKEDDSQIPKNVLEKLQVTYKDFDNALKTVRPSALREVFVEKPATNWGDIGGLDDVKQELKEAVEWPLQHPQAFVTMGVKPPKGILLYGPPGSGKTLLAKAVANESQANFIQVKGPELLSKWVGESEKAVREVFKKARQSSPTIIFFDEIDSLTPHRSVSSENKVTEKVVNQLLTELDGLDELHDVVVIAATNRPDMIDSALLRPGRFDRIILTPVPDKVTRKKIFEVHTVDMPLKDVDLDKLVEKTDGYVGADIEAVCREAAILALRKSIKAKEVTMSDFNNALKVVKPSTTKEIEKAYEEVKGNIKKSRAEELKDRPAYMG